MKEGGVRELYRASNVLPQSCDCAGGGVSSPHRDGAAPTEGVCL